jgi:two-component system, cell cycle sensor histidine kinase and response regulator CckA
VISNLRRHDGSEGSTADLPLRVLFVEHSEADVELCTHELRRAGFEVELDVAPTREVYEDLLASGKTYDIVLSDYRLPGWTGMDALDRLRAVDRELPFVLVTGSLGDEGAVECIKRGASDYVLKENLVRLPVSVRRALAERRLHLDRRRQEQEKEALLQQLLQAQKMEAVGRLAGGIAHDFNNLLTAILGYGELLLRELGERDHRRQRVEEILKATQRAIDLTRQLLAFSRRQALEPRVVELTAVVAGMENMLRRLIGEQVVLETRLDPELGAVRGDPGQLEQVILNLALNARDAMPEGGTITLETRNQTLAKTDGSIPSGSYVVLEVSDTGQGMAPDVLAHVFEPFFTTKELGRGTGLGLATVHGIVSQSQGHITVESRPGEHSRFTVILPRVARGAEVEPSPAPAIAVGGSETILVVEDDPGVRGLVRDVLSLAGYEVLEAATAREALELCRERPGGLDLVLMDIVLPDMRNNHLREALAVVAPAAGVLLMSGYPGDGTFREPIEDGIPFLQKPFSGDELARKVREVLGAQ